MHWRTGEKLRCPNPECRLELVVLSVGAGKDPTASLICYCGSPMKRFYERPVVRKLKFSDDRERKP